MSTLWKEALLVLARVRGEAAIWSQLSMTHPEFRSTLVQQTFNDRLLPHQRLHVIALLRALHTHRRALDMSGMGCGKSFTACATAASLKLPLVVYGPGSAELNWREAFEHFAIRGVFHPYSVFQRKRPPYHTEARLSRTKLDAAGKPLKHRPKLTADWEERCAAGLLLVLDEVHLLKNDSQRSKHLNEMTSELAWHPRSRLLMMSGTPLVDEREAPRLAQLLMLYQTKPLVRVKPSTLERTLGGLEELYQFCEKVDASFARFPLKLEADIAVSRCLGWLRGRIAFSMRKPVEQVPSPDLYRFVYDGPLSGEYTVAMCDAKGMISRALGMLASRRIAEGMRLLSSGMTRLEFAKIPAFIETTLRLLEQSPNGKVIVMLNYLEPIKRVSEALAMYNPLVIQGTTKIEKRHRLRVAFQTASTQHRVLVANMSLLNNGVNLDDQDGRFPRMMLVSLSYHGITLQQVNKRVHRIPSRSTAAIYYVALQGMEERSLYANLQKKATMLATTTGTDAFELPTQVLHYSQL